MRFKIVALAGLATAIAAHAHAAPVIQASAAFGLADLGTAASSGYQSTPSPFVVGAETITFTGGSTGVYAGNTAGVAITPFTSGLANYLAVEPGGQITITFNSLQTAFNLLFGSIDSYNILTFNGASGAQTVTGADVIAATGSNANQYISLSGLNAFNTVTLTSTSPAFEFVPGTPVPEPASLAVLGTGVLLMGLRLRRKRSA